MATLTPRPRVIIDGVEYDALELQTKLMPYAEEKECEENRRCYWNPPLRASVLTPNGWKHFEDCHVEKRDGDFYVTTVSNQHSG